MSIRKRGKGRKVDYFGADFPVELGEAVNAEVKQQNKAKKWPPWATRSSVVIDILSKAFGLKGES